MSPSLAGSPICQVLSQMPFDFQAIPFYSRAATPLYYTSRIVDDLRCHNYTRTFALSADNTELKWSRYWGGHTAIWHLSFRIDGHLFWLIGAHARHLLNIFSSPPAFYQAVCGIKGCSRCLLILELWMIGCLSDGWISPSFSQCLWLSRYWMSPSHISTLVSSVL